MVILLTIEPRERLRVQSMMFLRMVQLVTLPIKVQVGYLSRTIQLRLHAPFQFSDISLNPNPLAAAVGTAATLNFTIPAEAAYLLPINRKHHFGLSYAAFW